jgi:hypothetical protein
MCEDDKNFESFEEQVRAIADELGRTVERTMGQVDLDEIAQSFGVNPDRAMEWLQGAGGWLRAHAEDLGEEVASRGAGARTGRKPTDAAEDPLSSAGPHPLDLPTEEQGLALAALYSGRWTIEPGSDALAAQGDGPGPNDALGLVRELRVRDWIGADGSVTLVGHHALGRWLAAATPR